MAKVSYLVINGSFESRGFYIVLNPGVEEQVAKNFELNFLPIFARTTNPHSENRLKIIVPANNNINEVLIPFKARDNARCIVQRINTQAEKMRAGKH